MTESQNLIAGLIVKHVRRQRLTGEENLLLKQWCSKSEKNQLVLDQFLDKKWLRENLRSMPPVPAELMWEEIERNIKRSEAKMAARSRIIKRTIIGISLSAAAVVIILVGRSWISGDRNGPVTRSEESIVNKIESVPAEKQVVLEGSDGSKILLDGIFNGSSATLKDGRVVRKINADELAYDREPRSSRELEGLHQLTVGAERKPFTLRFADGTRVDVKGGAQCRYSPDRDKIRDYWLKGEAWFDIKGNKLKPAKVFTSDSVTIQVLGTRFAVNTSTEGKGFKVSVTRGAVKVSNRTNSLKVTAGNEAVLKEGRLVKQPIRDGKALTAWSGQPVFHFVNTEMNEAIGEIAEWYGLKVVNFDKVKGAPISGDYLRDQSPEELLKTLEAIEGGKAWFHISAGIIFITRTRE